MIFKKKKATSMPSSTGALILLVIVLVVASAFIVPKIYTAIKLILPSDWFGDDKEDKDEEIVDIEREKEIERIGKFVYGCFLDNNKCGCIEVLLGPIAKSQVTNWLESNKRNDNKWGQFKLTWEIGNLQKNKYYTIQIRKDADCLITYDYKGECVFISEIMDPRAYNCPI